MSFVAQDVLAERPTISTYGTPGIVELPVATPMRDGELSFSSAVLTHALRTTVSFQAFPRVTGTFRYSAIPDLRGPGDSLYDRSFDAAFHILRKEEVGFDLSIGLRDFIGNGRSSAEYLALTRSIGPNFEVTGGIGWGRLSGRNSFSNPLSILSNSLETREQRQATEFVGGEQGRGGEIESELWFRGEASLFGGIDWKISKNIDLQLEYSPDLYGEELDRSNLEIVTPINIAMQYRFDNDATLRGYLVGGENIGAQLNFFVDPKRPVVPGGAYPGPTPVLSRNVNAAASWDSYTKSELEHRLAANGLRLESLELGATHATVYMENIRWNVEAQAAGRAARVMAQTLPTPVETFTVVFQSGGLPLSSVTTERSDLESLQYDYDGAWRSLSRAEIRGAGDRGIASPRLTYALSPYIETSLFDPQSPIRADIGPQFDVKYRSAPGLSFSGRFRYPIAGNLGDSTRESDSVIERVRSESYLYAREADFEINKLAGEYLWRPNDDTFARVSAGYLESQFGGVSAEFLFRPIDSRTAYGIELNYAKQRDFDMLFGFQDYDVVTGHASVYHDLGNGYHVQLDAGRYLAGDWGATLQLDREFNNGVRVGGFFTLTDIPFDEFGEGSFDKGIEIEFPLSYFTGNASRLQVGQVIRPVLRDGGARLNVESRLYGLTRDYAAPELSDGWGLYLR